MYTGRVAAEFDVAPIKITVLAIYTNDLDSEFGILSNP